MLVKAVKIWRKTQFDILIFSLRGYLNSQSCISASFAHFPREPSQAMDWLQNTEISGITNKHTWNKQQNANIKHADIII